LHGGANEQVLRMLKEIGSISRVPEYVKRVRAGQLRLRGFGHRVYKNHDPRARIIKKVADDVLAVTGRSPLLDIALELERVALADDYFIKHRLYPNVDFYSGIIYAAIGFPVEMCPALFAIDRTPGWLAQRQEGLLGPEQPVRAPRPVRTGPADRHLAGLDRDLGLGRFAGGGGRIDAGIRGAVGQQDDHRIVLGLRAIRVGDAGELGDRHLDRGTDRRSPAGPKRTQGIFHRAFVGG